MMKQEVVTFVSHAIERRYIMFRCLILYKYIFDYMMLKQVVIFVIFHAL